MNHALLRQIDDVLMDWDLEFRSNELLQKSRLVVPLHEPTKEVGVFYTCSVNTVQIACGKKHI